MVEIDKRNRRQGVTTTSTPNSEAEQYNVDLRGNGALSSLRLPSFNVTGNDIRRPASLFLNESRPVSLTTTISGAGEGQNILASQANSSHTNTSPYAEKKYDGPRPPINRKGLTEFEEIRRMMEGYLRDNGSEAANTDDFSHQEPGKYSDRGNSLMPSDDRIQRWSGFGGGVTILPLDRGFLNPDIQPDKGIDILPLEKMKRGPDGQLYSSSPGSTILLSENNKNRSVLSELLSRFSNILNKLK